MPSDEELVANTLVDGSHHFGVLIERHSDYLFGLGMRLTSGHKAQAEDLSQQAFMKAFMYLKSFNPEKQFKHWLTGIAVNCFKDIVKKENQYLSLPEHHEPFITPNHAENLDFFKLIKPLTHEEKTMFTLKYIYEYQTAEIAEFMNLNLGTTKSKISRALEKLK